MANVLLLGLDDASAETISKLAIRAGHGTRREPMRTTFETRPSEDLIIVSGEQDEYRNALSSLRKLRACPPVLVVSRLGETSEWLTALEAGAADFLAAPYSLSQVDSAIRAATTSLKAFAA